MEDAIYDRDYNIGNDEIKNKRKEKLYEFAKQNNLNITREYLDYNFNEKGNMMNKLLDDIEKGKVRTVIFSSLDRISRNAIECSKILDRIENTGGSYIIIDSQDKKEDKLMMKMQLFIQECYKELAEKRLNKYKTKEEIPMGNEENFNLIKDKKMPLGRLLLYAYNGCIVDNSNEILGQDFDDFHEEQLDVKVIPRKLEKNEDNKLDVVIDFASEKDKELFEEYKYYEYDDLDEDNEDSEDDELEL